jgi:hypothetical protein
MRNSPVKSKSNYYRWLAYSPADESWGQDSCFSAFFCSEFGMTLGAPASQGDVANPFA